MTQSILTNGFTISFLENEDQRNERNEKIEHEEKEEEIREKNILYRWLKLNISHDKVIKSHVKT